MGLLYRRVIRPILFEWDSEEVHHRTLSALEWISSRPRLCAGVASFCSVPSLPVRLFGLDFPNPLGLAAGMDKYAAAVPIWEALGFGFCELGGVTRQLQDGNPKPRLWRVASDKALINRMGFNNPGAERFAERLALWRRGGSWPQHPVGINLGKSKSTPLEEAAADYAASFERVHEHGDFFVVNVSSPNTPGLRRLQSAGALSEILAAMRAVHRKKPILIKVDPDLSFEVLDELLELAMEVHLSGLVATNTTLSRPTTCDPRRAAIYSEAGGLSGRPLRTRSNEVIRHIYRQTKGRLPIIGVGGIFDAEDAWQKVLAGASLLQVYTGLVYEGPGVVQDIVRGLQERLTAAGLTKLEQAVGRAA